MYDDDEDDEAWEARGERRSRFIGTLLLVVFVGPLLVSLAFNPPFRGLNASAAIAIVVFFGAVVVGFLWLRRYLQERAGGDPGDPFPWD